MSGNGEHSASRPDQEAVPAAFLSTDVGTLRSHDTSWNKAPNQPASAFDQVQTVCAIYIEECQRNLRRPLREYLRDLAPPAQPTLLRNLLHLEIQRRRAAGEQPDSEQLIGELPEFSALIRQ